MKKSLSLIGISASLLLLAGCGNSSSQAPQTSFSGASSANFQEITGTEMQTSGQVTQTGTVLSGQTHSGVVVLAGTGSATIKSVVTGKDITSEVKTLIQQRATKPVEKNKLTPDDIDLMEKVIQKVQQK